MEDRPGLVTIDLQDELAKVADFAALPNGRKVASRLELMQSPTSPDRVVRRHISEFKMIGDDDSDGDDADGGDDSDDADDHAQKR